MIHVMLFLFKYFLKVMDGFTRILLELLHVKMLKYFVREWSAFADYFQTLVILIKCMRVCLILTYVKSFWRFNVPYKVVPFWSWKLVANFGAETLLLQLWLWNFLNNLLLPLGVNGTGVPTPSFTYLGKQSCILVMLKIKFSSTTTSIFYREFWTIWNIEEQDVGCW